jgi:hypothetical protein
VPAKIMKSMRIFALALIVAVMELISLFLMTPKAAIFAVAGRCIKPDALTPL